VRAPELLAAILFVVALPAQAALGEATASVQADRQRMLAVHRQASGLGFDVHTLNASDGSVVRQYIGADGIVFAVTWSSRGKPRLDQLLGRHFDGYAEAGRKAMQRRAGVMHAATVQQGDLVVESTAHVNAFVGRAWLRSKMPVGMGSDALR
jgi:hypothetical protein